jgi:hypothetical protein
MIPQPLEGLKIETTDESFTAHAGLPLVAGLFHALGFPERLNEALASLKQRRRGYSPAEFVRSLVLLHVAGGECLDDIRLLNGDMGLRALLGGCGFPAANTLGSFLRAFGHREIAAVARLNAWLANRLLVDQREAAEEAVLDFDSTFIEADKRDAEKTYKGFRGYNPLLATVDGVEVVLGGLFRDGNASPASHAVSFLRLCLDALPPTVRKVTVRSDSAWYQSAVLAFCHRRGVGFTVTADLNQAVRRTIRTLRRKGTWERLYPKDPDAGEVAETSYVVGDDPRSPAYRLVVCRVPRDQGDLWEGAYRHVAIITNIEDRTPAEIVRFHRGRGDAENRFKELKGGFGMDTMPCGDLFANAAYFQTILLAHNLIQCLKVDALPDAWRPKTIKTLRFRLFSVAGRVVRHARRWVLKLPQRYPFFDLFAHALWEIAYAAP